MENREEVKSIIRYLPVFLRSSNIFWPPPVVEALKSLSGGPNCSNVDSGELLFLAISDMRNSLSLSADPLSPSAPHGISLFFDDLMSRAEATKWFGDVVPELAKLVLRLPALLESHYVNAQQGTALRLLESQEPGIVLLSQELVGALLACSLLCLFPVAIRGAKRLPTINFDQLFASLYDSYDEKQENKIKCIVHYFERISSHMPRGNISFMRKVLPLQQSSFAISYPMPGLWKKSTVSLCPFQVYSSGLIEDQTEEALEVDFANKYIGGGVLHKGCLQEEIRFVINPELILGMLFLPAMAKNEAIEIVGAERFSNYTGYASSFRFSGNYMDKRDVDMSGRRKTRITAIDAKSNPGYRQYKVEYIMREINKAYCGFIDQSYIQDIRPPSCTPEDVYMETSSTSSGDNKILSIDKLNKDFERKGDQCMGQHDSIGIATGNWGCGAFGGDPELKTIIQWLAASQASRPFISYYTFGIDKLQSLDQVTRWIMSQKWTVGDLWNMLIEYSSQKLQRETKVGFCSWLLPSLHAHDPMDLY
ncbi:poly(ADP-ribose) glycohydrolase 1 isoform X1 [Daucus carota subsp. sativus]|uniref:poly(ADP-ribose) glycohydrolase 1 isoform X1 n=1 Tax=Daucus carota subsp. sativus TaxID=79200 RepID=UPI0007F0379B|nr:PREDICTED: poly(ADP-ribose) glycohydrolase 1-like [Daucus carota subsp. sativus]